MDEKLLSQFASQATGDLCPMQAVMGSMAAQEVMKVYFNGWLLVALGIFREIDFYDKKK